MNPQIILDPVVGGGGGNPVSFDLSGYAKKSNGQNLKYGVFVIRGGVSSSMNVYNPGEEWRVTLNGSEDNIVFTNLEIPQSNAVYYEPSNMVEGQTVIIDEPSFMNDGNNKILIWGGAALLLFLLLKNKNG